MKSLDTPLQAVTFDAAGTLIHLTESVGDSYSRVAAGFAIHAAPADLNSAFRTVWKRTPPPFPNPQGKTPDCQQSEESREPAPQEPPSIKGSNDESSLSHREKAWWKRLVREVFTTVQATDFSQFDAFFEQLYDHFESPGCWALDEAAVDVLDHLSAQGLKLGLLSNFDHRLRRILADLGIFDRFDAVILSGEIEAAKPDPRMFQTISAALACEPAEILHVGDDQECDIAGAQRAGFRALRVKPPDSLLRQLLDFDHR